MNIAILVSREKGKVFLRGRRKIFEVVGWAWSSESGGKVTVGCLQENFMMRSCCCLLLVLALGFYSLCFEGGVLFGDVLCEYWVPVEEPERNIRSVVCYIPMLIKNNTATSI
jgi:hypothetical protein